MQRSSENMPTFLASCKSILLVLTLATTTLLIRKTDSFLNPQFWAEDGTIFFLQQYEIGIFAVFQPYAGYLNLVPRLVALFADSFFPYSEIPFVYNYLCFIITLFAIASIFSPRFEVNNKPLLALAVVLVPHYTNEIFLTITNIQWILFIPLVTVLMKKKPDCKYGNINLQFALDFLIIVLCGLTGPFIIFLIPFFVWKWFKDKSIYSCSIMLAIAIISLIQLRFILFIPPEPLQQGISLLDKLNTYSEILGRNLIGSLLLGQIGIYDRMNYYFLSIIYPCLILAILRFYSPKDGFVATCLGIQLIILVAVLCKFRHAPELLLPVTNGGRYFYLPYVMLTWSLIALLGERERWKKHLTKIVLMSILISSLTSGFHSEGLIDYNWKMYSKSIGRENVVIPINPKGWELKLSHQNK